MKNYKKFSLRPEIITKGCTRLVFLIGHWAIKIPRFDYGWKMGLYGLLANLQEKEFSTVDSRTCPITFSVWGGWCLIMRRCSPVTDDQWNFIKNQCPLSWLPIPVEYRKRDSFGSLNGRIVVVDFGS